MNPDIKRILDLHPKSKSKRQLFAEASHREWEANWKRQYEAEMQAKEDAIPYESRKKFIEQFKAGGITLGDAARANGIADIGTASRILSKQIKSTYTHIEDLK